MVAVKAWREGRLAPPWLAHGGGLLVGWGSFNLLDSGNHFILGVHHVRDDLGGPVGWDIGFLVLALGLIVAGWTLTRRRTRGTKWRSRGRRGP